MDRINSDKQLTTGGIQTQLSREPQRFGTSILLQHLIDGKAVALVIIHHQTIGPGKCNIDSHQTGDHHATWQRY